MARKPHLIDIFVQRLIHSVSAGSNPAPGGIFDVLFLFWNFLFRVRNYCITPPPPFFVCVFFLWGSGSRLFRQQFSLMKQFSSNFMVVYQTLILCWHQYPIGSSLVFHRRRTQYSKADSDGCSRKKNLKSSALLTS